MCFWRGRDARRRLRLRGLKPREWTDRDDRRLARRLKEARLAVEASLEDAICDEKMGDLSEQQVGLARRWIRLSRCRPVLELASIVSLGAAVLFLARG
jgi:hypothetical protein